MSSIVNKTLGALFLAAAVSGAPSCADTDSAIFIRQVQLADPSDDCVVSADPSTAFVSAGVMDTALTSQYRAWLLIGNQLIPRGNNNTLRPETSRVHFYESEVTLFDFSGSELAAYTQPLTGFADPTSNTQAGYGLAQLMVVDPSAVASLPAGQTIVARIKVYGRTLGGIEVETDFWDFPIEICSGCLSRNCQVPQNCDAECIFVCRPGQDLGLDCRTDPQNYCNFGTNQGQCVQPL